MNSLRTPADNRLKDGRRQVFKGTFIGCKRQSVSRDSDGMLQGEVERTSLIVLLNCFRVYGFGTTAQNPKLP